MDEKISKKAIQRYSEEYASRVSTRFFAKKDRITGPEILTISEIKQVNLFVIRELMHVWIQETEKLKSPYFNYQAPHVKEAIAQFQNVLSNHIAIAKSDLVPLLQTSVAKTIHLILAPYDFYSDSLDRYGKGYLKTEHLKNEVKYLKINKAPLETLVAKLEEQKLELITGNEAFGMLDHILEEVNFTPEDVEVYIDQFSITLPLTIGQLYEQKQPPIVEIRAPEKAKSFDAPIIRVEKGTLADHLGNDKSSKLKDNLTINQKFMFTKILFKGDFEIFSRAMDQLDSLATLNHALAHIGEYFPEWDRESEEYEEFIEVLQKRFN